MSFDVSRVREAYPALAGTTAWLDGAAGTQVPQAVIDAVSRTYQAGTGNQGGAFPAAQRADEIVAEARQAVADLVGGQARGVVFGPNMTTLTYRFAATLSRRWRPGDEIVVSRLDHDANIRPWVQAAEQAGATIRWAEVDVPAGELPVDQYDTLLTDRTRLVTVTAASNIIGTLPDVAAIAAKAHRAGAMVYVDGVHGTPHRGVDAAALGADFYATSAYKWSGPHIGAVVADPDLLDTLRPDKLVPSPDAVPERFETGTLPFASLAGVTAAVNHLAALDPAATGDRRQRLVTSMAAVERYEQGELAYLLDALSALPRVRLVGTPRERTATAWFTVAGTHPAEVAAHLARHDVNVWAGHNYAWELAGALGVRDAGGAVRAGLVHYNTRAEVDRLIQALSRLA